MGVELNGSTKIALKLAETVTVIGLLLACTWAIFKLTATVEGSAVEIKTIRQDLSAHCRSDWGLQHEILMAQVLKARNPESKITWVDPVEVHDSVRRAQE